jgi:ectoine hydroxylase-related dioxygenase (phytanoyl-CoA dioxygenase family)
MMNLNDWGV